MVTERELKEMKKFQRQSQRRLRPGAQFLAILAVVVITLRVKWELPWVAVLVLLGLPTLGLVAEFYNARRLTRLIAEAERPDDATQRAA